MRASHLALIVLSVGLFTACGSAPPPPEEITVWRPLGKWSGRGLLQTEAFDSNTGMLRVSWEARAAASPGAGTLRIAVHSAVSGRFLALAVDQRGAGKDVTYVNEDPRSFFLVIESTNLDWSVDVAEGIPAVKRVARSLLNRAGGVERETRSQTWRIEEFGLDRHPPELSGVATLSELSYPASWPS